MIDKSEVTWIDIDAPRKEHTFKDLNCESSGPRFKDIQDIMADEKSNFKDVEKLRFQLKQMLESFMYTEKRHQFNEANSSNDILRRAETVKSNDTRMSHQFFNGRDEWREFERHVEIITQFMKVDSSELKSMMEAMKKAFIALAEIQSPGGWGMKPGEGALNAGFNKLNELDDIFKQAGIDGLEPAIRASRFLDLLSPYYKGKETKKDPETGKQVKYTKEKPIKRDNEKFEYDISAFIKILDTRKSRKIANYINDDGTYLLGDILKKAIRNTNRNPNSDNIDNVEMTMEIFRKLVNQGGYTKNNAQVGKGEIALAMFFDDCSLPDKKGDIEITKGKNKEKVEIKGNDAGITERTTIIDKLLSMTYSEAKSLMSGHSGEWKASLKKCGKALSRFKSEITRG